MKSKPSATPKFVRWTDYLTERSCVLRVSDEDWDTPLSRLVARYLARQDATTLVSDRNLLPESLHDFLALQDLVLSLSDGGSTGDVIPGCAFQTGGSPTRIDERPEESAAVLDGREVGLVDVTIDRSEVGYARNWEGFNARRWHRTHGVISDYIRETAGSMCESEDGASWGGSSRRSRIAFLRRLAEAIWNGSFENHSRFTGGRLRYKTGDEALLNIISGKGAICSEKVQALKFVTDRLGFESHYVFAGPGAAGPLPVQDLRRILDTFDFLGAGPTMRYWQHMALEYVIEGERILVDATNGNIPFLFVMGPQLDAILGPERPRGIRVRMGTYAEEFYYHRAPDDLALDLCYAMENFIPEIDLIQVFDNELGLMITPEFLVTPLPYRSDGEFRELRDLYLWLAETQGLNFELGMEWALEGELGAEFARQEPTAAQSVLESHDYLRHRYDRFEGRGHTLGLGIIQLRGAAC